MKFMTWFVVTFLLFLVGDFYTEVERPDHNMPASLAQFKNDNEATKELRQKTFIENNLPIVVYGSWALVTIGLFYGDFKRGVQGLNKAGD